MITNSLFVVFLEILNWRRMGCSTLLPWHPGLPFQVSLLLKDSFIDSFPDRDRPFIKVTLFRSFKENLWEILILHKN